MRSPRLRGAAFLAALLALALLAAGATPARAAIGHPNERLADPALEERARAVGRELRCLVCQNQSIEDSDADLARQLRVLVRERIAAGASEAEARDFVHARYGDFVLLRPPVTPATVALWATPVLALALGGGTLFLAARRRRAAEVVGPGAAPPLSEAERARLVMALGEDAPPPTPPLAPPPLTHRAEGRP